MNLSSFGECVASLSRANNDARPLLQGRTATGLLLACFDQGERGITTIIANDRVGNDRVITLDERPERLDHPDCQIKIAAIAVKHLLIVDPLLKATHRTRRDRCLTTLCVGNERASSPHLDTWYLELTTKLHPDGNRSTFLGYLTVQPLQNFAG